MQAVQAEAGVGPWWVATGTKRRRRGITKVRGERACHRERGSREGGTSGDGHPVADSVR